MGLGGFGWSQKVLHLEFDGCYMISCICQNSSIILLKIMDFIVCKLYLNKAK